MKYPTLAQTVEEVRTLTNDEIERLLLVTKDRLEEYGREHARITREILDLKRELQENNNANYGQAMFQAVLTAELDARKRYL
ncbi:MAG: hypothetical protein EOM24_00945 [Chloroflexia bacterium]|nr:hypothetical protein [Chloroflexia bacterium]